MKKIKLGIVITDTNFGGGGRYVLDIAKYIDNNKFKVFVIIPEESLLKEKLKKLEKIYIIEAQGIRDKSISLKGIKEIKRIIKENNIEIIHTNSCLSGRIAGILSNLNKIVYTRHCIQPEKRGIKKNINKIVESILSKNTKVIAVSKAVYENLKNEGISEDRIKFIYNGIDTKYLEYNIKDLIRKYKINDKNTTIITLIGRLETVKGQENMIEIVKILNKERKDFEVFFVGEGSNRNIIQEEIDKNKLPIRLLGHISDIEEICSISDIIVNTSNSEALSLSSLEAFVYKKPVVAFSIDGLVEVVENKEDGFLIKYLDYNNFAEKLSELIEDKELRKNMGISGRNKVIDKFNIVDKVKELEGVYLERSNN